MGVLECCRNIALHSTNNNALKGRAMTAQGKDTQVSAALGSPCENVEALKGRANKREIRFRHISARPFRASKFSRPFHPGLRPGLSQRGLSGRDRVTTCETSRLRRH